MASYFPGISVKERFYQVQFLGKYDNFRRAGSMSGQGGNFLQWGTIPCHSGDHALHWLQQ